MASSEIWGVLSAMAGISIGTYLLTPAYMGSSGNPICERAGGYTISSV